MSSPAPHDAEQLAQHGLSHLARREFAAAVTAFSQSLTLQPGTADVLSNRGAALHALGDFAGAVTDYTEALRLQPNYAQTWNNRGAARRALGDLAGALADYDEALRLEPVYAEAYNNRGLTRQAAGDLAGARTDFSHALRIRPDYLDACANRGAVCALQWDHAAAAADFSRALAMCDTLLVGPAVHCRLHVFRGDARYHLGVLSETIADYRTAFQLDGPLATRLIVDRVIADMQADLPAVLADCARHLQHNPDNPLSLGRRGLVRLLQGRTAQARSDLERALLLLGAEDRSAFELMFNDIAHRVNS